MLGGIDIAGHRRAGPDNQHLRSAFHRLDLRAEVEQARPRRVDDDEVVATEIDPLDTRQQAAAKTVEVDRDVARHPLRRRPRDRRHLGDVDRYDRDARPVLRRRDGRQQRDQEQDRRDQPHRAGPASPSGT